MMRLMMIAFFTFICLVCLGQDAVSSGPEFGEELDGVSASLSLPERADEGRWVFDITVKNSDKKKNRALLAADKPTGWDWELEGTGGNAKKYSGCLSTRMPPNKIATLAPGESKKFRISNQNSASAFDIPPGIYRLRLSYSMYVKGEQFSQKVYTNWKEFKIEAEGEGADAAHRDFPHISAGIGGKLSVPTKPAGPLAFNVTLRNFANAPMDFYFQAITGFGVEFRPVGDDKTVYRASADYEKPDSNTPPAILARTSKPFQAQVRASLAAVRIDAKGTREFTLDVMKPYSAGPLKGTWTLTKMVPKEQTVPQPALPPGRYRVRAFYDPAPTIDSIVSFIIFGDNLFRGIAVTNAIEVEIP